jgi:hypothetical protein
MEHSWGSLQVLSGLGDGDDVLRHDGFSNRRNVFDRLPVRVRENNTASEIFKVVMKGLEASVAGGAAQLRQVLARRCGSPLARRTGWASARASASRRVHESVPSSRLAPASRLSPLRRFTLGTPPNPPFPRPLSPPALAPRRRRHRASPLPPPGMDLRRSNTRVRWRLVGGAGSGMRRRDASKYRRGTRPAQVSTRPVESTRVQRSRAFAGWDTTAVPSPSTLAANSSPA